MTAEKFDRGVSLAVFPQMETSTLPAGLYSFDRVAYMGQDFPVR